MTTNSYTFIDYENVQPDDLHLVPNAGWEVKVFLGPKQNANHASLNAAQRLGGNCNYISVLKPGRNALDFYIAYFLGTLSRKKSQFYIISNDTGFDPFLEQLNQNGILAHRCKRIAEIPGLSTPNNNGFPAPEKPLLEQTIEDLVRRQDKKPTTLKRLHNALCARFHLTDEETTALIDSLKNVGMIQLEGNKVIYLGRLHYQGSQSKAA